MSKKLSKEQKKILRERLDMYMHHADQAIQGMMQTVSETNSKHKALKLKQTLLSLRVEYNRLRLKYEDD